MDYHISDGEYRLLEMIWEAEPVNSTELVKLCGERYGWKKSTTYTVLKKLVEKEAVENHAARVTARIKREELQRVESREFLEQKFQGSLPEFLTAFLQDRKLTKKEAWRLHNMIEEAVEDE